MGHGVLGPLVHIDGRHLGRGGKVSDAARRDYSGPNTFNLDDIDTGVFHFDPHQQEGPFVVAPDGTRYGQALVRLEGGGKNLARAQRTGEFAACVEVRLQIRKEHAGTVPKYDLRLHILHHHTEPWHIDLPLRPLHVVAQRGVIRGERVMVPQCPNEIVLGGASGGSHGHRATNR